MKRLTFILLLLNGAVLVFAQTPRAFIREMTGTVEIKRAGTENWAPARLNDAVAASTVISTGFKSTAVLAVGNSTITVRPLTRMSLETLMNSDNTEKVNVNLNTGKIRAEVKPPAGGKANFEVQSNKTTASVRGTVFEMTAFKLSVVEGSVSFQPTGGNSRPVMVNAGQQSWVSDSGEALNPIAALEAELELPPLSGRKGTAIGNGIKPNGSMAIILKPMR